MKVLLVGLWVTLVALGTAYGVAVYMPSTTGQAKAASAVVLQSQKTRVLNVPIVTDGQVRGFMAVQFVFTTDANLAKALQVPPEVYLLDEAFRTIYADSSIYLNHDEKYDLKKLTSHLVESTNAHLGVPMIKDVLIENFEYIDKDIGKT